MGRKDKDNISAEVADVAETAPVEMPVPVSGRITTEDQAKALLQSEYAELISEHKTLFVSEDRNVFTPENESYALNHTLKNRLKLFSISWD